jgi:hypothetical protein
LKPGKLIRKRKKGTPRDAFSQTPLFIFTRVEKVWFRGVFYSNKTQTIPRKVFDGTIGKGSPGWGAPPGSAIV